MSDFELLGRELRQDLTLDQLVNLEDACVVFEQRFVDTDRMPYWVYTVGGRLNGEVIGGKEGGALVGGQTIIVHGRNRTEADRLAYDGLIDTIKAETDERERRMRTHLDNRVGSGIVASSEILSKKLH